MRAARLQHAKSKKRMPKTKAEELQGFPEVELSVYRSAKAERTENQEAKHANSMLSGDGQTLSVAHNKTGYGNPLTAVQQGEPIRHMNSSSKNLQSSLGYGSNGAIACWTLTTLWVAMSLACIASMVTWVGIIKGSTSTESHFPCKLMRISNSSCCFFRDSTSVDPCSDDLMSSKSRTVKDTVFGVLVTNLLTFFVGVLSTWLMHRAEAISEDVIKRPNQFGFTSECKHQQMPGKLKTMYSTSKFNAHSLFGGARLSIMRKHQRIIRTIILCLPMILIFNFASPIPQCLYNFETDPQLKAGAKICSDVEARSTLDPNQRAASCQMNMGEKSHGQSLADAQKCMPISVRANTQCMGVNFGDTMYSTPQRLNLKSREISVILDMFPPVFVELLSQFGVRPDSKSSPLAPCISKLTDFFCDAMVPPCGAAKSSLFPLYNQPNACLPLGIPCKEAMCHDLSAVCTTKTAVTEWKRVLSAGQAHTHFLDLVRVQLKQRKGGVYELFKDIVEQQSQSDEHREIFSQRGLPFVSDFVSSMLFFMKNNSNSILQGGETFDFRYCLEFLDKVSDKSAATMSCSAYRNSLSVSTAKDYVNSVLNRRVNVAKDCQSIHAINLSVYNSTNIWTSDGCPDVCELGGVWLDQTLFAAYLCIGGIATTFTLQIISAAIFFASKDKSRKARGLHCSGQCCHLKSKVLTLKIPYVVTIISRFVVPQVVIISVCALLFSKLEILLRVEVSDSGETSSNFITSLFHYLFFTSSGIRFFLLCVILLSVNAMVDHVGSAAVGMSHGWLEMVLVASSERSSDNPPLMAHQLDFSLASLLCKDSECSITHCRLKPHNWYSRNFGFRRGRFFFHRTFTGEILEWFIQYSTLSSFMHTTHVAYTYLALNIMLLNVLISPTLFLIRRCSNSTRYAITFWDTLLDLNFMALSIYYVQTSDDLLHEINTVKSLTRMKIPVWTTVFLWPSFCLVLRAKSFANTLIYELAKLQKKRKKYRYVWHLSMREDDFAKTKAVKEKMTAKLSGSCCSRMASRTRLVEILTTLPIVVSIAGITLHAIYIIGVADSQCAFASPSQAMWQQAYPRIVTADNGSMRGPTSHFLQHHTNPLVKYTQCRFDLITKVDVAHGKLEAHITKLPQELANWSSLETMDARNNRVSSIPLSILEMKSLNVLLLEGNPIHRQLNLSSTGKLINGTLPFQLRNLAQSSWDLMPVSLNLFNTSLAKLPANLSLMMPCLNELTIGGGDQVTIDVAPSLFYAAYSLGKKRSASNRLKCGKSNAADGFHLTVDNNVQNQTSYLNWSYLATPLSRQIINTDFSGNFFWNFLDKSGWQFDYVDVRCSGLRKLNFEKLLSSQSLSSVVVLDLSENYWDTEKWKVKEVKSINNNPRSMYISELWTTVHRLRTDSNLQGFRMDHANLNANHFSFDQAIYIDEYINASSFEQGFSVSENKAVSVLNWQLDSVSASAEILPKPPLWLAEHLLPTLKVIQLTNLKYDIDGTTFLKKICEHDHVQKVSIASAFGVKTELPYCLWQMPRLTFIDASNVERSQEREHYSGHIPSNLTHLKELKTLNFCDNRDCDTATKYVSMPVFKEMYGTIPQLPESIMQVRLHGMPNVTGEIPDQWENLSNLWFLELHGMPGLRGPFKSHVFKKLTGLRHLTIDGTHISGELPWSDGLLVSSQKCHKGLNYLALRWNVFIEGNIFPNFFPQHCSLVHLQLHNLGYNNLSAVYTRIPESIVNCRHLSYLEFDDHNTSYNEKLELLTGSNYLIGKSLVLNCNRIVTLQLKSIKIFSNGCDDRALACRTFFDGDGYYLQLHNGACVEIKGDVDAGYKLPYETSEENVDCNTNTR